MNTTHRRRLLRGVAVTVVAALSLAACGGSDGDKSSASGGADDVKAALAKGGTITVWAWEPTLTKVAKDFEAEHPNVKVKLVNAGTGNDQYTALHNAVKAGKGVPDLAQIEYYALPQFSLAKSYPGFGPTGPVIVTSSRLRIHAQSPST